MKQDSEYEQLAKSARQHKVGLLEREGTYSQYLSTCNDVVNSQCVSANKLEKHIAEVKTLLEQAVEKSRDEDGAVLSDVAIILKYPIKYLLSKEMPSVE